MLKFGQYFEAGVEVLKVEVLKLKLCPDSEAELFIKIYVRTCGKLCW